MYVLPLSVPFKMVIGISFEGTKSEDVSRREYVPPDETDTFLNAR